MPHKLLWSGCVLPGKPIKKEMRRKRKLKEKLIRRVFARKTEYSISTRFKVLFKECIEKNTTLYKSRCWPIIFYFQPMLQLVFESLTILNDWLGLILLQCFSKYLGSPAVC